ncbi:MAG: insulinase family protein [Deltaproteobacteria bacterium]|nr:insulinase family protein [Deltaproteobacteria bacterium]
MAAAAYQHTTTKLGNGLTVVTVAMPHLHSATVSLFARVGSRHETPETNGITHFLEHMVFRGCDGFPDSTALNTAMEDLGGTLDGYTMRELSSYHSTVHPSFVDEATNILGAMFRAPSFSDIQIEREIILEEILDGLDERGRVIDLDTIAHREAFRGHPLGQSIDGPRKNLQRFNVEDLETHRRRFYGARNMVLCLSGNVEPRQAERAAERAFGAIGPGKRSKEIPPSVPSDAPRFAYVRTEDPQTRVRFSFRTVPDTHPDYPALILIRRILDGGLSARLQVELVEKRGIAYDIGADLETYADCGLFDFELAVAHKKLPYALEELSRVILDIRGHQVAPDELDRVRRRARIGVEFVLDSTQELGNWFGATQLFREPITPEERISQLENVTPEMIKKVARRYFDPSRLSIAAVGNAEPATIRAARKVVQRFTEAMR